MWGSVKVGQKFARLLVLEEVGRNKSGCKLWKCLCDCGNETIASTAVLRSGHKKSCGCYKLDCARAQGKASATHGGSHTRLWNVYRCMLSRCYNEHAEQYKNYGSRGIGVCEEWKGHFEAFREWANSTGYDPDAPYGQCTLDRIDVDKNYSPQNCRWADAKTQGRNKRNTVYLTVNGVKKPLSEWAEITNQNYSTLHHRMQVGYTDEEVVYGKH